jgi:co-chaperonin GroES (HSP10)
VSEIALEDIQKHLDPQHDRIVVEREPDPKKTTGGLHLPDTIGVEMEMTNMRPGKVVAIGPGRVIHDAVQIVEVLDVEAYTRDQEAGLDRRRNDYSAPVKQVTIAPRSPMDLKVGDRVMFYKNAGEKIFVWGRCFQIMGDGDVGLKIRPDTPIEMVYAQMVTKG